MISTIFMVIVAFAVGTGYGEWSYKRYLRLSALIEQWHQQDRENDWTQRDAAMREESRQAMNETLK